MKANVSTLSIASFAIIALTISGCSSDEPMATADSGVPIDMARTDTGVAGDMAVPTDTGVPVDMAALVDMGVVPVDMAIPVDMAVTTDAGGPMCGNGIIEGAEECDDSGTTPGDGCDGDCQSEEVRTAFRITSMHILDPHAFLSIGACFDGTDLLNGQLDGTITGDDNTDGNYDLSIALSFLPLDPATAATNVQVSFPDCLATTGGACTETPADPVPQAGIAANMSTGTCLTPVEGTTRASYGTIDLPMGPCFQANFGTTTFDLNGIAVTLRDTRFAAEYSGAPASELVTGLVQGFLTEADAEATMIPESITLVGGMQLSALLPGGEGNCRSGVSDDDRDTYSDGTTRGWYFYMSFEAETVTSYTAL
jgi:cysteine-rich repeat protein